MSLFKYLHDDASRARAQVSLRSSPSSIRTAGQGPVDPAGARLFQPGKHLGAVVARVEEAVVPDGERGPFAAADFEVARGQEAVDHSRRRHRIEVRMKGADDLVRKPASIRGAANDHAPISFGRARPVVQADPAVWPSRPPAERSNAGRSNRC